jgi:TPR repeat protein
MMKDSLDAIADAYNQSDFVLAFTLIQPLAVQGDVYAQYHLGEMYAHGLGVTPDAALAVYWYGQAAIQGDADAQYCLGKMYSQGQGIDVDDAQAFGWYIQSAEQGFAPAQYMLGLFYAGGLGVEQDIVVAHQWCNLAAEGGIHQAASYRDQLFKSMTKLQLMQLQIQNLTQSINEDCIDKEIA